MSLKPILLFWAISITLLNSCSGTDNNDPESYIGEKISVPSELASMIGKETTVLSYYDIKDCMSCKTKELSFWNDFLGAFHALMTNCVEDNRIIFVVNTRPNEELSEIFATLQEECNFIIYYDIDDTLKKIMPAESQYQCFLLDRKLRVLLIGKPIFNSSLFDKYLSFIFES